VLVLDFFLKIIFSLKIKSYF